MKKNKIFFVFLCMSLLLGLFACVDEKDNDKKPKAPVDPPGNNSSIDIKELIAKSAGKIGDPCSCTSDGDNTCSKGGYEVPTAGIINGCKQLPAEHQGAKKACLRSASASGVEPKIYFSNGSCTLILSKCEVEDPKLEAICAISQMGDASKFDEFKSCPDGGVLVNFAQNVKVSVGEGISAKLLLKACMPACQSDSDCRVNETDSVYNNEKTQRKCVERDSTKFCMDERNLTDFIGIIK